MARILFAMLLVCIWGLSAAQQNKGRLAFINEVLSDTLNAEVYLIPVHARIEKTESIWIGYSDALSLYEYTHKRYGWSKREFIEQMRSILVNDRVFVNDTNILSIGGFIQKSECSCLYNESSADLKKLVESGFYRRLLDRRFTCFVYRCFMNNVQLVRLEENIGYMRY